MQPVGMASAVPLKATSAERRAAKKAATAAQAAVRWESTQSLPAPAPPSPPCARPEAGKQRRLAQVEGDFNARDRLISQAFELESRAKAEHAKAFALADDSTQLFAEHRGQLPGQLHEQVLVTPRGRRAHKLKHTSPGGTTRVDEYLSPAGMQQQVCQERSACWRRLVAARHAETQAHILGCGECASCLQYAAYRESESAKASACVVRNDRCQAVGFKRKPVLEMTPSQAKRSRLNYGMCERL
jgi:hypothetical protein